MYRVLNEIRVQRLMDHPIEYLYHDSFENQVLEDEILAPMPDRDTFEDARREYRAGRSRPPVFRSPVDWLGRTR